MELIYSAFVKCFCRAFYSAALVSVVLSVKRTNIFRAISKLCNYRSQGNFLPTFIYLLVVHGRNFLSEMWNSFWLVSLLRKTLTAMNCSFWLSSRLIFDPSKSPSASLCGRILNKFWSVAWKRRNSKEEFSSKRICQ